MQIGSKNDGLLMKLLDATVERDRVLGANIANINTPGYKRRVHKFEELLHDAMLDGENLHAVKAQTIVDVTTPSRLDGNNVSLEAEVSRQRENRLLYETYVTMLQGEMGLLDAAIRGTGA